MADASLEAVGNVVQGNCDSRSSDPLKVLWFDFSIVPKAFTCNSSTTHFILSYATGVRLPIRVIQSLMQEKKKHMHTVAMPPKTCYVMNDSHNCGYHSHECSVCSNWEAARCESSRFTPSSLRYAVLNGFLQAQDLNKCSLTKGGRGAAMRRRPVPPKLVDMILDRSGWRKD